MSDKTPGIGQKRPVGDDDLGILLKKLRDFDDNVRIDAAKRLGNYPRPQVVKALIGRLIDRSSQVRWYVIDTLVKINDKSVCESITEKLEDEVAEIRGKAAEALGILGCKDAAMALVNAVDDGNEDVTKFVGLALGQLSDQESMHALIQKFNYYKNEKKSFALAQFGYSMIDPLIKKTDYHSSSYPGDIKSYLENRVRALTLLDPLPFDEVVKFYDPKKGIKYNNRTPRLNDGEKEMYTKWGYNPINLLVTQFLFKLDDPRAISWLSKILVEDAAPLIRWLILNKFARMTNYSDDVVRSILKPLKKDYPALRAKAARTLGEMKATSSVASLCHIIDSDSDTNIVYEAITAVGSIGDLGAIHTLVDELINNDRFEKKRQLAAKALGKINSPEGIEALISSLGSDGAPEVRKTAAISLGNLKAKEAVRPLGIVANGRDENEHVIQVAKEALKNIK
jgi:HEAT repeat protein